MWRSRAAATVLRSGLAPLRTLSAGFERARARYSFIKQAAGGSDTSRSRLSLIRRFGRVHRHVFCAHQEAEALILADAILRLGIEGPLVELGCYKGGSTAKLSFVARATSRRLYVFDSFSGLPAPKPSDAVHHAVSGRVKRYREGDYLGELDEVRANVARWGAPEVCEFVPGDFSTTLATFTVEPALIFMDVDLIESARTCLQLLWPLLRHGGRLFTHEAGVWTFVDGVLDPTWWHDTLKRCPPVLYGAGYGFGPHAANLAYFKKDGFDASRVADP